MSMWLILESGVKNAVEHSDPLSPSLASDSSGFAQCSLLANEKYHHGGFESNRPIRAHL